MPDAAKPGHVPVLLDEAVDALAIRADGVYVDGTYGRGGHSGAIFARLGAGGRLLALDRDPEAVEAARQWARDAADPRFAIEQAPFSRLAQVAESHGHAQVDGVLLDLGVSSPQLDDPARGFSFRHDGPLDMRMDPGTGVSARQWLLTASESAIAEVVRDYGEERFAVQIAKAIIACRQRAGETALQSTAELADLVASVVRPRQRGAAHGRDPATRTFQALRIFINQELDELARGLEAAVASLARGGRLVVISFHSLEDRIVKQYIAHETGRDAPIDPVRGTRLPVGARLTGARRMLPTSREVACNARARSAVLRLAERI
jgi:16S rRNA (cytosine1402-N4)-methyltransferase